MPVTIFSIPVQHVYYALNQRGRHKYGTLDNLLDKPFFNCEVGTPYGYQNIPTIRQSSFRKSKIIFSNQNELNQIILDKLKDISPEFMHNSLLFDINSYYKVLKYQEGQFFKEHIDKVNNNRHYGTLLIFPPAQDKNQHTGGKMLLEEQIEFNSSNNLEWKVVAFTTYSKHQIEKITSGQRIVFKTELFYSRSFGLPQHDFPEEPMVCD